MAELKKVSDITVRLREALTDANMRQSELARQTDIDRGSISNYLSGRYEPKTSAISKMAKVLGVSEMWLYGYDVPKHRSDGQKKNDQLVELIALLRKDNEFREMTQALSQLTPEQRNSLKPILAAFTNKQFQD